ncbi:MAG: hypothetical protein KC476_10920, partial [Cyanobacteria bacterium HKST-UBA06]|nr:hypothetical protein [Cyanobacteria bacterium HKST-UBA06]
EGAAEEIAKEAIKRRTGARALKSIVEELMLDLMYEVPSREDIKTITVTRDMVKTRSEAEVIQLVENQPQPINPPSVQPKSDIA